MDKIVEDVIYKMRERSEVGINKYGTTLMRDDLSHFDWLNHLQEELMDATLYLEKLMSLEKEITFLVKNHPNDSELGMVIRNLVR